MTVAVAEPRARKPSPAPTPTGQRAGMPACLDADGREISVGDFVGHIAPETVDFTDAQWMKAKLLHSPGFAGTLRVGQVLSHSVVLEKVTRRDASPMFCGAFLRVVDRP